MKLNHKSVNKIKNIAKCSHWSDSDTKMYFDYLKLSAMKLSPKDGAMTMIMAPNGKSHTWIVKNGELVF